MISKNLSKAYLHSFTERPTFSVLSHLQINYSLNLFETLKTSLSTSDYIIPIMIVSSGVRLLQIPTYYGIMGLSSKLRFHKSGINKYEKPKFEGTYPTITKKLFINDLKIDCLQKEMNNKEFEYYKSYYSLELLGSYVIQIFLILNNLKAINYFEIIKGISVGASLLPIHLFIPVFISNYFFLKHSNHPWLINTTKKQLLYVAFFFSLPVLFFSTYTSFSWIGYNLTHIALNCFYMRRLKNQIQKKSIQEYYLTKKNEFMKMKKKL